MSSSDSLPLNQPLWLLCCLPDEGTYRALLALFAEEISLDDEAAEFECFFDNGSVDTLRAFARARWQGTAGGLLGEIEELAQTDDGWWLLAGFQLSETPERAIITELQRAIEADGGRFYLTDSRPAL